MKYPTQSALQNHYLQSILPHGTYRQQKPFSKTKEFYQPQKFIWNNPHRTSAQMYKFYHAYNDKYISEKEPEIKRLEDEDRKAIELQRILKLTQLRKNVRNNFFQKRKERQVLEARCRKHSVQDQPFNRDFKTQESGPLSSYQTKSRKEFTAERDKHQKYYQSQISDRVAHIENSYKDGLQKYDHKREEVGKLIVEQTEAYHRQIREEFSNRKHTNLLTMQKSLKTCSDNKSMKFTTQIKSD